MRKITCFILTLLMILSFTGCSKKEEKAETLLEDVQKKGYIVMVTEGDWSPWTYHDEQTNELTGFAVELGREIAAILGVEAEFKETTWDSLLAGCESGMFDLGVDGVSYTNERALSFTYTDPIFYSTRVLIVAEDNDYITCWEDIKGYVTVNSVGSTYADLGEYYGAKEVLNLDKFEQCMEAVADGRADATINSEESYEDYVNAGKTGFKVVDSDKGDFVGFITKNDEYTASFMEAVNNALQQLRDNGKLAELSIQFFGVDKTTQENN